MFTFYSQYRHKMDINNPYTVSQKVENFLLPPYYTLDGGSHPTERANLLALFVLRRM